MLDKSVSLVIGPLIAVGTKACLVNNQIGNSLSVLYGLFMVINFRTTITLRGVEIKLYFVDAISESKVRVVFTLNHAHILAFTFS